MAHSGLSSQAYGSTEQPGRETCSRGLRKLPGTEVYGSSEKPDFKASPSGERMGTSIFAEWIAVIPLSRLGNRTPWRVFGPEGTVLTHMSAYGCTNEKGPSDLWFQRETSH